MIALKGVLTAKTPFMVYGGESEDSDADIIRNKNGEVFIPGTSLAGVCRDYLEKVGIDTGDVFGFGATGESSDEKESDIIFYDAFAREEINTSIRDAVRLERRVSKKGCKFDFETAEPKSSFDFRMEINHTDSNVELDICKRIVLGFCMDDIRIGAKTTRGFGIFDISDIRYLELNLDKKTDIKRYINFSWDDVKDDFVERIKDEDRKESDLFITLEKKLTLDSFIFIRNYATIDKVEQTNDSKFVDAATLTNKDGDVVIPGTSIAGIFRNHILRFLDKVGYEKREQFIDKLFGYQIKDDELKNKKTKDIVKSKSNIFFDEILIKKDGITMINRTRTAIDRFSGSALQTGALFTGRVAYKKDVDNKNPICLKVKIKKDFKEAEFAKELVEICFSDIEKGYLAVGGNTSIGAGMFEPWEEK